MGEQDHHAVLGLAKDADPEVIKAAYRALAKKHHPDCLGGSAERFGEISRAWEALSEPETPLFASSVTQLKKLCDDIRRTHDQAACDAVAAKPKSDHKIERRSFFGRAQRAAAPVVCGVGGIVLVFAAAIVLTVILAQNSPAR
jgi:hypothetical protein